MFNLVTAKVVLVALVVALQCYTEVGAHVVNSKLDNHLPNVAYASILVVAGTPKRRTIKKFVHITESTPEILSMPAGSRQMLECNVMGKPAPTVQWLKNGIPLAESEKESNEIFAPHETSLAQLTSRLFIENVADGDEFTCLATAGLKSTSFTTTVYITPEEDDLLVLKKLLLKPSKPVITSTYNDVFQDMDTDLLLPCRAFSTKKTHIVWEDSEQNKIYGHSGRMQVLPSGDLVINGLTWSDLGNFTCTAKNMYGKDTATTFVYPTRSNF